MKHCHSAKGWGVLFGVVLMTSLGPASSAAIDCDQYLKAPGAYSLDKAQIMQLQKVLDANGIAHGDDDGVMGPQTRAALKQYCLDATEVVSYSLSAQNLKDFQLKNEVFAKLQALAPNADPTALTQSIDAALKDLPEQDNPAKNTKKTILLAAPTADAAAGRSPDQSDKDGPTYGVNPALLNRLKQSSIPEKIITVLQPLQGRQYASAALFDNAVEAHLQAEGQKTDLYQGRVRNLIQQAAQKRHPMDERSTIQWESAKCGCVQDLAGAAYGFYPYWMAVDGAPAIEFSALTRIGYFAVLMDPTGRLKEHALWKKEGHRAGFVKQAHRYRTQVDLVICPPPWPTWYRTLIDHQLTMIETVTELLATAPMSDGVTLYFKNYPDDNTYSRALAAFLGKLHEALKNIGPNVYLNLMLPAVTKENEKVVRDFFTILFADPQAKFDFVRLILVFLYEPTTDTKKQMRYIIEKSFKGHRRRDILRKIVPILSPPGDFKDKIKNRQFEDDLIYFEDNFGGVGFWPLPTGEDETLKAITAQINHAFLKINDQDFFQRFIFGRTQWLCNFICPHRMLLRWMLAAAVIFLLCCMVGPIWICELRFWYRKFFWYVMGLLLVTGALLIMLMACDPDVMRQSTEIFIVLFIVLIVSVIYRQIRKMKQAKYP